MSDLIEDLSTSRFDYWIKITMIGNSGVGKTALLTRFCDNKFDENVKATIGIETRHKIINKKDMCVKVNFCDTAG